MFFKGLRFIFLKILRLMSIPGGRTLSVQVRVHHGMRDYDKSFVPTPESPKSVFNFVAMDEAF
jgi:hypothetical protein